MSMPSQGKVSAAIPRMQGAKPRGALLSSFALAATTLASSWARASSLG